MTKKNALKRKLVADWKATKVEIKNPGKVAFQEGNNNKLIHTKYFKAKRRFFRALLEDIETKWFWSEDELKRFEDMWAAGYPVTEIVRLLPAQPHEVALLIVDAEMRGAIKARPGGHLGAAHPDLRTEPISDTSFRQKQSTNKRGKRGAYGKRVKENSEAKG